MQRITIISSIIAAVCVFQTAEAGVFDKLTGSLPNIPILNPLGNQGNVQKVTKSNPMETYNQCMEVYKNGYNTIDQVKKAVSNCFSHKTNNDTNTSIRHLNDKVVELQKSITEAIEKTLKCGNNLVNILQCLDKVYEDTIAVLIPLLQDVIEAAKVVMDMYQEKMSGCYQTGIENTQEGINNLVESAEKCVKNVKNIINLLPF